jgi:hypothetical protein
MGPGQCWEREKEVAFGRILKDGHLRQKMGIAGRGNSVSKGTVQKGAGGTVTRQICMPCKECCICVDVMFGMTTPRVQ